MSRKAAGIGALVLAATVLHAGGVQAKNVVVFNGSIPGATNCRPDIAGTPFLTIKAAMNALPIGALTASNTVFVCPGTYPEQIVIDRNISITGVVDVAGGSNSAEVNILPPAAGFVNYTFPISGIVQAQIVAQNIADLNLTNLTLDGANQCPAGVDRTAGIALSNVGVVGTSTRATISKSVVRKHVATTDGFNHCASYLGEGIIAENSWFTADSNVIRGGDYGAIHQIGGISKITNNNVGLGFIGIWLRDVVDTSNTIGTTVSGNNVSDFSTGIYLDGASNVLAKDNIIGNWTGDGVAIVRGAADNQVSANKIFDANKGVYLNGGGAFGPSPTRNIVKGNTIIRTVYQALALAYSDGTNQFINNTISEAPVGIFVAYVSPLPPADILAPNTFNNVKVLNATGSYVP